MILVTILPMVKVSGWVRTGVTFATGRWTAMSNEVHRLRIRMNDGGLYGMACIDHEETCTLESWLDNLIPEELLVGDLVFDFNVVTEWEPDYPVLRVVPGTITEIVNGWEVDGDE